VGPEDTPTEIGEGGLGPKPTPKRDHHKHSKPTLRAWPAAPTEVEAENLPADHTNASVLAAIGAARTSVTWHLPGWPPIDELSLQGQSKHATIQATLNSSDIDALAPAHGHLVYLHVGPWPDEQARASWLAQRVGCEILGPSEHGW